MQAGINPSGPFSPEDSPQRHPAYTGTTLQILVGSNNVVVTKLRLSRYACSLIHLLLMGYEGLNSCNHPSFLSGSRASSPRLVSSTTRSSVLMLAQGDSHATDGCKRRSRSRRTLEAHEGQQRYRRRRHRHGQGLVPLECGQRLHRFGV